MRFARHFPFFAGANLCGSARNHVLHIGLHQAGATVAQEKMSLNSGRRARPFICGPWQSFCVRNFRLLSHANQKRQVNDTWMSLDRLRFTWRNYRNYAARKLCSRTSHASTRIYLLEFESLTHADTQQHGKWIELLWGENFVRDTLCSLNVRMARRIIVVRWNWCRRKRK